MFTKPVFFQVKGIIRFFTLNLFNSGTPKMLMWIWEMLQILLQLLGRAVVEDSRERNFQNVLESEQKEDFFHFQKVNILWYSK